MILKILTRHSPSYKSLINYILQECKTTDGQKPEVITHNLRGQTVDEWVKEYLQNEALRSHPRKNQIYLTHEILSFGKADRTNITKEILNDFAKEYIRQRGIEGMYVIAVHEDREHYHLHACASGLQFRRGKAHRLSRTALQDLKLSLQNYHQQKFPEIQHSTCEHGKGRSYVTDREYYARQKQNRQLIKVQIKEIVRQCYEQSRSRRQFYELLQNVNLPYYERNGKPQGIVYEDIKFRFTRLGIEKEQLGRLPEKLVEERTDEQNVLDEIDALRSDIDREDYDYDIDD